MSDLSFDNLRYLHLGWTVLVIFLLGLLGLSLRRRALRRFADAPLLSRLTNAESGGLRLARLVLVCVAMVAMIGGLVGPRWGEQVQQLLRRNIDIVILLDVSKSMLARDIAPSRLERAKLAIREDLLPALGGDRVAIVAFAGATSSVCPLTSDYGFVRLALDDVTVQSVPRGGTLIGDAIRKAGEKFDKTIDTHRIILLISDGEDHESFPVEAARGVWDDLQAPIISVALGDPESGARIPEPGSNDQRFLEYRGETVWSKASFETLRSVAEVSPMGVFVPVGTSNFDLGEIYRKVAGAVRATESVEARSVSQPSRMHYFAVAALLLVLIDSVLRDGPRPLLSDGRVRSRRAA